MDTTENRNENVLVIEKSQKPLATPDLSAEISANLDKRSGERVRCRRIAGDTYRCNWLALDDRPANRADSMLLESYRIRESKFLRARKTPQGLVIEDLTATAATNN